MSHEFGVSTDSSGVFGLPRHWKEAWPVGDDPFFNGYEMLAWGGKMNFWTNTLISQARSLDIKIAGIHGRTGGIRECDSTNEKLLLYFLNQIVVPTPDLLERASGLDIEYVLFHSPELKNKKNKQTVFNRKQDIKLLYVENHIHPNADNEAISVAKELRQGGVNAGIMFDILHHIRQFGNNGDYKALWDSAMTKLEYILEQTDGNGENIPVGIHIPIGTSKHDALRLDLISLDRWRTLGRIIQNSPQYIRVVIENQQSGLAQAFPIYLKQQTERNERKLGFFRRVGVI